MGVVLSSYRVSGFAISTEVIVVVGLGTWLVYRSQRMLSRFNIDFNSRIMQKHFVFWVCVCLFLIKFFMDQFTDSWRGQVYVGLLVFSIPGFLYGLPMRFKGKTYRGLRSMPYLKVPIVIVTWMLLVCLPWVEIQRFDAMPWAYMGMMLCYLSSLTLLFDLRDCQTDMPHIKTISNLLGPKNAMGLIYALLGVAFVLSLVSGFRGEVSSSRSIFLAGLQALMLFLASQTNTPRTKTQETLWYEGVLDGVLNFWYYI